MNDFNEFDKTHGGERARAALVVIKSKWGLISKFLISALFVGVIVLAVLTVQRAREATAIKNENAELKKSLSSTENELSSTKKKLENAQNELTDTKEQLEYAEGQVDLLQESTDALIQQVGSMEEQISWLEEALAIKDAKPKITIVDLEEQLSSLSELVTAKYFFRNSAREDASKTWIWGWTLPFSDTSLLVAYDGTIKAGIDFNAIKIEVNESQRKITVTLPASKILDNNIPQETINVLEVKNNLFNEVTFADYNQFISDQKKVMEQKAVDQGLLTEANTSARALIKAFLSQMPGMDTYTLVVQ